MFFCQSINITFSTLQQARPLLDERNLNGLVDPRLGSTYFVSQMQAMISAAALCVKRSSQQRPKISEVSRFPIKSLSTMGKFRSDALESLEPLLLAYAQPVIAKI
jgi:hypothetical protein